MNSFQIFQTVSMTLLGGLTAVTIGATVGLYIGRVLDARRIKAEVLKANKRLQDQRSANRRIG